MPQYVNRTLQESIMKNNSSCITLTVIDNHNMVEEIRVSIIIIKTFERKHVHSTAHVCNLRAKPRAVAIASCYEIT